jgi:hypothetical protein
MAPSCTAAADNSRRAAVTAVGRSGAAGMDVASMLVELTKWRQYFLDEPGPFTGVWAGLIAILLIGFVATLFFSYVYGIMIGSHPVHRRINQRIMYWGLGLNGLGLGLAFWRLLGWGLLNRRIFPSLVLVAEAVMVFYALYYMHTRYRQRMVEYRAEEERRRYLPRPKPATVAARRRRR